MWQNSECKKNNSITQSLIKLKKNVTKQKNLYVTKLKNLICDKAETLKVWQSSKTQNVTELKNSNSERKNLKKTKCDKTQNLTKLKIYKTRKLRMWQNSKTQNFTKLKHKKYDQIKKIKMWHN